MNMYPTEDEIAALLSATLRDAAATHHAHTEPRGKSMIEQCAGEWRDATPGDDVPRSTNPRLLGFVLLMLMPGIMLCGAIAFWMVKL